MWLHFFANQVLVPYWVINHHSMSTVKNRVLKQNQLRTATLGWSVSNLKPITQREEHPPIQHCVDPTQLSPRGYYCLRMLYLRPYDSPSQDVEQHSYGPLMPMVWTLFCWTGACTSLTLISGLEVELFFFFSPSCARLRGLSLEVGSVINISLAKQKC